MSSEELHPNAEAFSSSSPVEIDVDEMDGEAGAAIAVVLGLERSPCGEHTFVISKNHIYGYGSEDGITDGRGRSWCLKIKCPYCGDEFCYKKWDSLF